MTVEAFYNTPFMRAVREARERGDLEERRRLIAEYKEEHPANGASSDPYIRALREAQQAEDWGRVEALLADFYGKPRPTPTPPSPEERLSRAEDSLMRLHPELNRVLDHWPHQAQQFVDRATAALEIKPIRLVVGGQTHGRDFLVDRGTRTICVRGRGRSSLLLCHAVAELAASPRDHDEFARTYLELIEELIGTQHAENLRERLT